MEFCCQDSRLLREGGVCYALVRNIVLAHAIGADKIDDSRMGAFESEATPSSHARGVGDSGVCAARPFVMGEKESPAGLVNGAIAWIDA